MKTSIQLIAFDLFGVVISEGHMVSNTLMPLLPANTDKLLVKQHYQAYTLGNISENEFWRSIGQHDYHDLRDRFLNSFELDPDFRTVAKALKAHYQLAILSNLAKDWGEYLIDKFSFEDNFSPIIISGEVLCGKPDPAIYQQLISQSSYDGTQMAFIDDRLENLAVANDMEMMTIHYHREVENHSYKAQHVITDMTELMKIFSE